MAERKAVQLDRDGGLEAVPPSAGCRAKTEVLQRGDAVELAAWLSVHLSGHGGTHDGVLGALAAVGLHLSGDDGLFLWMEGIRGLYGRRTLRELSTPVGIDDARDARGDRPEPDEVIELGSWVRPILSEGRAVLLLEPTHPASRDAPSWRVAPREFVKQH